MNIEKQIKVMITPPTFYYRHWDLMSGDGLHRWQTLNFSEEETASLKKFLRGVKEVSIRVGMAYEDDSHTNAKYYVFLIDTSSEDEEFCWPDLPENLGG